MCVWIICWQIRRLESVKNRLDIQIESLDRQIDEAVYELYGLTEEEIRIVEGREKTPVTPYDLRSTKF